MPCRWGSSSRRGINWWPRSGSRGIPTAPEVKELAKPAFAAWVTNQTVRRAPVLVRNLLEGTDALAAAQRKMGRTADSHERFQAAMGEQRRVLSTEKATARAAAESRRADERRLAAQKHEVRQAQAAVKQARGTLNQADKMLHAKEARVRTIEQELTSARAALLAAQKTRQEAAKELEAREGEAAEHERGQHRTRSDDRVALGLPTELIRSRSCSRSCRMVAWRKLPPRTIDDGARRLSLFAAWG